METTHFTVRSGRYAEFFNHPMGIVVWNHSRRWFDEVINGKELVLPQDIPSAELEGVIGEAEKQFREGQLRFIRTPHLNIISRLDLPCLGLVVANGPLQPMGDCCDSERDAPMAVRLAFDAQTGKQDSRPWTEQDTVERLAYIEKMGYDGVGEFEVRLMLDCIKKRDAEIVRLTQQVDSDQEELNQLRRQQ